jgi:beta-glucosidase
MSRYHLALVAAALALIATGTAEAGEMLLSGGAPSESYTVLIGDKKQWDTPVGADSITSASGYLSVAPDTANSALKARWNGKGEAQFFIASDGPADYSKLLEQDAALVVLMQIVTPPKKKVVIKMGCGYPCAANANITKLLKALPVEQWLRVSFDLKCFADGGLDITNVDTSLLLTTAGKMSVSIADVSIVPGVGPDAAIRCR